MSTIPPQYTMYFDAMQPGSILSVSDAQDQAALKHYAKQYIDQTGLLEFNPDMTRIKRLSSYHIEVERLKAI